MLKIMDSLVGAPECLLSPRQALNIEACLNVQCRQCR